MSSPSRIGRYAVRRRIGSGGFATVWLGYDEQLDSPVAVKVLADNWSADDHVRRRFVEEGRFLRKVESPHVVPVYDAGELPDGRPYLVMAFADQGNLEDRLDLSPLPLGQAVAVVEQVGGGLHALHQRGVIHRDVKPANVLFRTVDDRVRAMVGDLGLGKALDVSSRLTMIGGTPSYVSPEQARGEGLDARTDQYSLAVLTYRLLAGRPPFTHATLTAAATPSPPPAMSLGLPDVEAVVRRALAVDRAERWPTVPAYVEALRAAFADHPGLVDTGPEAWIPVDPQLTQPAGRPALFTTPTELPEPTPPPRRRHPARAALAGLVATAVGLGAGYAWWSRTPDQLTVMDDEGAIEATVPSDWGAVRATEGWTPPGQDATYPALSLGTAVGWGVADGDGSGVFAGLMPGVGLPQLLPGHPECERALGRVTNTTDGRRSITESYAGCPGGGVAVERVVAVADNRLLWVQVRSPDQRTASSVLDSVRTRGI